MIWRGMKVRVKTTRRLMSRMLALWPRRLRRRHPQNQNSQSKLGIWPVSFVLRISGVTEGIRDGGHKDAFSRSRFKWKRDLFSPYQLLLCLYDNSAQTAR